MPSKVDPPVLIAKAQAHNNKKVLAARLRAIAKMVLDGKKIPAWHALIALAEKVDPDTK